MFPQLFYFLKGNIMQKNLQSLQTVIFGSIKSGETGFNKPKRLDNGSLAFSVPVYSGEKDQATGKRQFVQYVQIYVSKGNRTAQMIAEHSCDKDVFLRFEGFIKASAYLDKNQKPQAQLTLSCFDIKVIKDSSDPAIDDASFDPADFSENAADFSNPPQF